MTGSPATDVGARLAREHRGLDDLLGRFLGASSAGAARAAREAIEEFDGELRRHTEAEELDFYGAAAGESLTPRSGEPVESALCRQMRLEHVQLRELSGIVRRLVSEKDDLEGARRLSGRLARLWDAHTSREEREVLPALRPPPAHEGDEPCTEEVSG